jgi:hypothetical protein
VHRTESLFEHRIVGVVDEALQRLSHRRQGLKIFNARVKARIGGVGVTRRGR